MTAPLTPPHQPHRSSDERSPQPPQAHQPHRQQQGHQSQQGHQGEQGHPGSPSGPVPPHGHDAGDLYGAGAPGDPGRSGLRADLRDGAIVLVAMAVLGVALGLLWLWLAPRVPLVSDGKAVFLQDTEGEESIGADGTFALLGLAFGVVTAAAVFWFRRSGGIVLVAALALGGLLGSVLAWRVGLWFGPTNDVVAHAKAVGEGVTFDAPLKIKAYGVLLAWSLAAMAAHLSLTALFGPRDPQPEPDWYTREST
ncbi:ABC transporter permease [Streptomyces sp. NPDC004838]